MRVRRLVFNKLGTISKCAFTFNARLEKKLIAPITTKPSKALRKLARLYTTERKKVEMNLLQEDK